MSEEEVVYYKLNQLGGLVNANHLDVISMLRCMQILENNQNPDTVPMYGKLTASEKFRIQQTVLFKKYFKDRLFFVDGVCQYELLITKDFVEFVKDRIEKVGDIYNVRFNK